MDKQSTIGFLLIGAILIVWLYMNSPSPEPQQKKGRDTTIVNKSKPADKTAAPAENKGNTAPEDKAPEDKALKETPAGKDTSALAQAFGGKSIGESIISVENSLIKIELTSKGARVRRIFLKNYKTWYAEENGENSEFYKNHVQLVNTAVEGGDYNVVFVSKDGKLINTSDAAFNSDAQKSGYVINDKDSLSISYTLPVDASSYIRKTFVFHGNDYSVRSSVEMKNMDKYISNYRYDVVWENGINFVEENSVDEANYSNASVYTGDEQSIVDASSEGEVVKKEFNGKIDWMGIRNKYFALIFAPDNSSSEGGAYIEGTHRKVGEGVREIYSSSLKIPFNNSSYQKNSFLMYFGPVDYNILKEYGRNFEAIVDFGSLFGLKVIIRPISEYLLLPLFKFLHLFIPNYGVVIIVFSLIIKLLLYPLTKSSLKSMRKMQMLQPKITELKEKFKDDPQRVQKETMKLYSTYGINPAGGCLPMLLQMPILVALWGLFNVAVELRQQPFALWIHNLSSPDFIFTLPFKLPLFGIDQVSGLALLLGITMFIQQKMSVKDPSQQALVYVMPVMFTLMFMGFPAGLNLYYFMFNLFSIIQQYWINHTHSNVELKPVTNPKKSGFMQRMMEAAEKSQQQQLAAKKKKN